MLYRSRYSSDASRIRVPTDALPREEETRADIVRQIATSFRDVSGISRGVFLAASSIDDVSSEDKRQDGGRSFVKFTVRDDETRLKFIEQLRRGVGI